jgi:hypothetical protein
MQAKRIFIIVLLTAILAGPAAWADPPEPIYVPDVCTLLMNGARDAYQERLAPFLKEVRDTRGLSLILKPYEATPAFDEIPLSNSRFRRVLTRARWIFGAVNPFNLTYRYGIKLPLGWVTQKKLGTRLMLTRWVLVLGSIFVFNRAYDAFVETPFQKALDNKLESTIQSNERSISDYILWDYRFTELKSDYLQSVDRPELRKQVLKAAYLSETAYSQYYQFLGGTIAGLKTQFPNLDSAGFRARLATQLSSDETWAILQDFVLFGDLRSLFEHGVTRELTEGFAVKPEVINRKLTREQKRDLMMIKNELYVEYETISNAYSTTADFRPDPAQLQAYDKIRNSPFALQLEEKLRAERLPARRIVSYLQEDAYWRSQFRMWKVLGVVRLQATPDGFSNEPLTNDLIRSETLNTFSEPSPP